MDKNSKIYIAGHKGLVGSSIVRALKRSGYKNLLVATSSKLNLLDQFSVNEFFKKEKPEFVFLAAAKVGGIVSNSKYPADFLYENLQIQSNVIYFAHKYKVRKLLFLGSSCIYPKECPQPIKEEYLLTGPLEKTNEAYAIAKIAGLMMCRKYKEQYGDNFISVMPTNIYGINDNFHPENSHVIPGLITRFVEAKNNKSKEVTVWGSGKPKREFIYVDDLVDAIIFLMDNYNGSDHINIGTGEDITIKDLAELIKKIVGFKGHLKFDDTKPDGTPRKVLDVSKILSMGWKPKINLASGLIREIEWFEKIYLSD